MTKDGNLPQPHDALFKRTMDCFHDKALAKQVAQRPVKLIDLSVLADSEIMKHGKAALLEIVQKHVRIRDSAVIVAEYLVACLKHYLIGNDLFVDMVKYYAQIAENEEHGTFFQVLTKEIPEEYKGEIMTIAESLKREAGQQKALEIAKNMAQMGLAADVIKKATSLSEEEVKRLLL